MGHSTGVVPRSSCFVVVWGTRLTGNERDLHRPLVSGKRTSSWQWLGVCQLHVHWLDRSPVRHEHRILSRARWGGASLRRRQRAVLVSSGALGWQVGGASSQEGACLFEVLQTCFSERCAVRAHRKWSTCCSESFTHWCLQVSGAPCERRRTRVACSLTGQQGFNKREKPYTSLMMYWLQLFFKADFLSQQLCSVFKMHCGNDKQKHV